MDTKTRNSVKRSRLVIVNFKLRFIPRVARASFHFGEPVIRTIPISQVLDANMTDDAYLTSTLRSVSSGIECCLRICVSSPRFDVSKGTCSYCTATNFIHHFILRAHYTACVPAAGAHTGAMKSGTPKDI